MRKFIYILVIITGFTQIGFGQLSGIKTIPGDYATISAAISALNASGVGSGGVTFNVAAGYTETITAPLSITATGTASNPIVFQKSGSGANPVITAYVGTNTPGSAVQDGIWNLVGSDYVTINGINLTDPNTTNPATMEYGYGFFKASATNGCQHNVIQNCTITLSINNNASGTAPAVDGSRGINVVNSLVSTQTTVVTTTAASGSNSYNNFYANTIQNCNIGIALIGYADVTPFAYADYGNDIGGSSLSTGNSILNFGGAASASNPAAGVRTLAQYDLNVSYNTINNNNGSGTNHVSTLRGIYLNTATSASETITNNTLTLKSGGTTSQVSVIENVAGATATTNTVTISNNTIQNCTNDALTTGVWYGIYNNAASANNLNINSNTFTGNTSKATSGATYLIYNNGAVPGTININNNNLSHTFNNTAAYTGATYSLYNSNGTTTTTLNITGNNFSNYTFTNVTGSGSLYFIYQTNSNANLNITGNTWTNLTLNHSASEYCCYNNSSTQVALTFNNNSIVTGYTRTAACGTLYFYYSGASALGTSTQTYSGNNFSNVTGLTSGSGNFYFLYSSDGASSPYPKKLIYNNTFSNCNYNTTGTSYGIYMSYFGDGSGTTGSSIYNNTLNNITVSGTLYGIYPTGTASPTYAGAVYGNTVSNLTTNGAASSVYGYYLGASTPGLNFYKNKVFGIIAAGSTGRSFGIYTGSSYPYNIYNNFISDIKAPTSSQTAPTTAATGIYLSSGTTINLFYNTVFMNATGSGTNFGTAALYASTTPTVLMQNNVLVNTSTATGTGLTVAYQRSSNTTSTYSTSSNNNDFYAGTPSATNLLYYDGTTSCQSLAAFQGTVTPRESVSVAENPPFINSTTSPYDMHISTSTATTLEGGGVKVTTPLAITDDYDGNVRWGETGYSGTGISTDIGADEFNGIYLDLTPPVITYTPLSNTLLTSARTLTATITDVNGVPTSGAGLPRLFWKINSGSWSAATATWVSGSTYSFTLGSGVVAGDIVYYYVAAQDQYSTPNVGCYPSLGSSGFTASPPTVATPPTTPSCYGVGPVCGTINVGVGQTFTTLTAAINDFNLRVQTCPVVYLLKDATYPSETFPIVINPNQGSSTTNTLTIKPATGVTTAISGAAPSSLIFKVLNSNTIIDGANTAGGTTRNLTIQNTSATGPSVIVIGSTGTTPITNVALKNSVLINGANTNTAVIVSDGAIAGSAGYFNNITIQNNSFQLSYIGLYCIASAASGNGSMTITQNDLNATGANSIRLIGVYLQGLDGATVTNNNIGNFATSDASNITGIWAATGTVNANISNNTIANINSTTGPPRGIAISPSVSNANITVNGNTINNLTTSYSNYPIGIYVYGTTTGVMVKNNIVSTLLNSNTSGYGVRGIDVATGITGSNVSLINNVLYDIKCTGDASLTYFLIGIGIESGTGGVNIYHNSVYLSGTYAGYTSATVSTALYVGTSTTSLDIRDNLLVNAYDNTNGSSDKSYAIYSAAANTAYTAINYNDYYATGAPGVLGYLGADVTTLSAWQTATAQDVNSISSDPVFTSTTNLLPTNLTIGKIGTYFASVPTDVTNAVRTNPPDMGAYEFGTAPIVNTTTATGITQTTATLTGTINANTLTVNSFFDYGLTTTYGNSTAGTPVTVTGTSTTSISYGASGFIASTTYHYRARGVTSSGLIVYGPDMTFTTLPPAPTVVTTAATSITSTGATLNGTVNANGSSSTVSFEYGLTSSYGSTIAGVPVTITGSSATAANAVLTGLQSCQTYHFRITATNAGGTSNGGDLTFTTGAGLPTAATTAATGIGVSTATLNGVVNANNCSATVSFDYGLTTGYGSVGAGTPSPVTGTSNTNVSYAASGLALNTTYHFRVNATTAAGTTHGSDMTFLTGCPAVGTAGTITGPSAVCANSTGNVYTVGTITNATSYQWTLPAGATITAGAGTNTITVTFGTNSGSVTVAGVGICGVGTSSSLTVTVNPLPVPTIGGSTSVCLNSNIIYFTQTGMTGYTWTVSSGGTITSGAGTNSIIVNWTTTGAKTVTVTYTNANNCAAAAPASLAVTVNGLPNPTITGSASVCQHATGVVYTTQPGMVSYVWLVSAGGTITAGGTSTSNTVTVTWNGSGAQAVAVNYTDLNGCWVPSPTTFPVTVNPEPVPTIGSGNNPCAGSTNNVYYTEGGMTNYNWTISPGGTITSGAGTGTVHVTWNTVGSQWIKVSYTNTNGCTPQNPTQLPVFVNPMPNAAGAITGTASLCAGTTGVAYSTPEILNATSYTWTVPTGATIASGAGTRNITVDFGATAASGNITVAGTNQCGNGTESTLAVTVNPLPFAAGTITGSAEVCAGAANVAYSVAPITAATTYVWTIPAGATITTGANTRNIKITFGTTPGADVITVKGNNACGDGQVSPNFDVTINAIPDAPVVTALGYELTSSAATGNQWYYEGNAIPGATGQTYTVVHNTGYYWCEVTINGCKSPISNKVWVEVTGIGDQHLANSFTVYPNPNKGLFNISLEGVEQGNYTIEVTNNLGVTIWRSDNVTISGTFKTEIDIRPAPTGVYMVMVRNNDSHQIRKVLVSN